ncbi:hypothetical protein ACWOEH_06735 [Enterococcus nangangensis]
MEKVVKFISVAAILLLLMAVISLSFVYADLSKIGTSDFDVTKWLDADVFLWRWGWYSLLFGVLLNIIALVLKLKGVIKR